MSDESTDEDWVEEQSMRNTTNSGGSNKSSPVIQLQVEEFYKDKPKGKNTQSPTKLIKIEEGYEAPFKI